jgi:membrane protease YdiL (CAAX protease family)
VSIRRLRPTPYWLFILIWLASVAVIAMSATVSAADLIYNLGLGVFAIITIAITQSDTHAPADSAQHPPIYAQIAFILLIIVITGLGGMAFHNMIDDYQGFMGVVFGIIFERTRSLIAPSIVHVVLNVFGSL